VNLVSVAEAMDFLKYDDEPPELALLISASSAAVLNYLGDDAAFLTAESDSEDLPPVPPEVKQACLFWLREMDASREGQQADPIDPRFGYGYPPRVVVALLAPLRVPRMA
jgi:hypothetical protein